MSASLHAASIGALTKGLQNMLPWLDKAEAHAKARGFEADNYLGLRLAPDMLPFSRQIQIATDMAKGCACRLAGVEIPKWDDNEATLDELRGRLRKGIEFLQGITVAQLQGGEARAVVLPLRNREPLHFNGLDYLQQWALPNFYFHCTTAYNLLRHAGVELGKADFLGR